MRSEALKLYDAGFMPIPLRREPGQRKKPSIPWRQYQNERPERSVIEGWFTEGENENVAIVTGRVSGVVVVDLDGQIPDPVGWLADHNFSVRTPIVSTGRGGAHVYYRHPGGTVPNGVKLREVDGVMLDIRADGGYVVAPPSLHDTGALYEWVVPADVPCAPFPQELMALVNRATEHGTIRVSEVFDDEVSHLMAPAKQGERNHHAARLTGYLLKTTKDDENASWSMLQVWNNQNQPPLPTRELRQTFESILRRRQTTSILIDGDSETGGGDPLPLMDGAAWADAVRDMPPRRGVPAKSLPGLEAMGGLVPRDLIILAGRPGMGKSTVAWNVVAEACLGPAALPTIIFSTEMTANDVARWMGARIFRTGDTLTEDQWNYTLDKIAHAPITICDAGAVTADQIVKIVSSRPETKLVIVDHIQRVVGRAAKGDNRNLEVGRTAQMLKSVAKDVGCTVLALSQMNRGVEQQGKPRLSSLRDSGEIEQEADAVIFLWTEAEDLTTPEMRVRFLIGKNRHGPLEDIECIFYKARKHFVRIDPSLEIDRLRQQQQNTEAVNRMVAEGV